MKTFTDRLKNGPCLLLDGGLGSMLIASGLPAGTPPDLWTLERPEAITDVHRAYVRAGSEAVHANTFGANPVRLAHFGLESKCESINKAAVNLARDSQASYVIADIGPTGEYLPPVGTATSDLWRRAFEIQGKVLIETPIDALHIETMTDIREAQVALEVLRSLTADIPIIVSLTFDSNKRGFFTVFGNPLVKSLLNLIDLGATAVGANCTLTSLLMADLAREARSKIAAPLVIQPNAGQPELTPSGFHYSQPPEEFAVHMVSLARDGIAALGGCCGTDPRHIAALKEGMDAL